LFSDKQVYDIILGIIEKTTDSFRIEYTFLYLVVEVGDNPMNFGYYYRILKNVEMLVYSFGSNPVEVEIIVLQCLDTKNVVLEYHTLLTTKILYLE
jgi:hypothetical protein